MTTQQVVAAETATKCRVQLVGGITPLLDEAGDTVALLNNTTIFGWFDKQSDSLFVARIVGHPHDEALKAIEGCESFEALQGEALEWSINYRQVAMSLPETVRPMMLHVTQKCGMAGPIHTGMDGLSVEITDLTEGETHSVRINEKVCFALMRNKRTGEEEIQFLNSFCGGNLFRLIDTPKHIKEYRRTLTAQQHTTANKQSVASADAKYSAADIAASMTRLAEPQHEYFQRRKEQKRKQEQKPTEQEPKQKAPTFKAKKDKLPEVPDSVRLSGPQKELILMRLADIGVEIPQAVAELPLRRGRHTRQETAGIVEFTMGQLSAVNAALKCTSHELVYVEEHNVYALRHTVTNLQYVFTQRDWEFVKRGKMDRRYSGR